MPNSGLRHIDVGPELSRAEWLSEETHELLHGTSFPPNPVERQLFYRDDLHLWFIFNGLTWIGLGMAVHGNEFHNPTFEHQGVAATLVETHRTSQTHTQPQPPSVHDNVSHNPAFATEAALTSHANLTNPHSATSAATPNRIVLRDANGRAKVAAPVADDDIARKLEVDAKPSTFLQLTDTPSSYSGQANKVVRVRSDASGLEFADLPGGGGGDFFALTRFLRAGRYHTMPIGGTTTTAITANTLYAVPFFTPVARTITRLAIHVTTAATGAAARLGIYNDDGSVYPGSLIIDAGTVDTGTTGVREITGLNISFLANTLYWLALVANGAPTLAATTAGQHWSLLGYANTAFNVVGGGMWTVTFTYGSLPSTFPTGASVATTAVLKIPVFF